MSYVVLARRYRPRTFDEVAGQGHVAETLKNALKTGRLAHAWLFAGPRGVGKTSMARLLARALNCAEGTSPEPCGKCESCTAVLEGRDVDVLEIDAASHTGVDDVRELIAGAQYATVRAPYKIYIVDEVHMLSRSAFNALLKTLEEPPAHVKFIFATTEPERLPETVHSRCQRFDFRRIPAADALARIEHICREEKVEAEREALAEVARASRGSLRDAESLLDQLIGYCGGRPITRADVEAVTGAAGEGRVRAVVDALAASDAAAALGGLTEAFEAGADMEDLAERVLERLRLLLVASVCGLESRALEADRELVDSLSDAARAWSVESVAYAASLVSNAMRAMRTAGDPRLPLEIAFVRAARAGDLADLASLIARLENAPASAPRAAVSAAPRTSAPAPAPRPPAPAPRPAAPAPSPRPQDPAPPPPAPESAPADAELPPGIATPWSAMVGAANEKSRVLGALLRGCRPVSLEDGVLTIGVASEINREMLEGSRHRELVEKVSREAFGGPMRLKAVVLEKAMPDADGAPPDGGGEEARAVQNDEDDQRRAERDGAVQTVIRALGGRFVGLDPGDRS